MKRILKFSLFCALVVSLASCAGGDPMQQRSEKTGWEYNDPKRGYFNVKNFYQGKVPVGMVYVPVNSYVKGNNAEKLSVQANNQKGRVAVSGFYMDMYEVTNLNWREYVQWMSQVYKYYPLEVIKVLPDETVWRSELSYNDPYERNYFSHVAFSFYPVVGVTWEQAKEYCTWRTDRINELELVRNGILEFKPLNVMADELASKVAASEDEGYDDEDEYGDDEYGDEYGDDEYGDDEYGDDYGDDYGDEYGDEEGEETAQAAAAPVKLPKISQRRDTIIFTTKKARDYVDLSARKRDQGRPDLRFDSDANGSVSSKEWNDAIDGLLFDGMCRLPTEAEWEFAAYGMLPEETGNFAETQSYPWNGSQLRHFDNVGANPTNFYANFVRGRGDLIGQSVNNTLTVPVTYFQPNRYGLFNMAGNVNEWVLDVYRTSTDDNDEINSFRGNEFDNDSSYAESVLLKYFPTIDSISKSDRDSMRNSLLMNNKLAFSGGDFRDFKDGDETSSINDSVLVYRDATGIEKANMISKTARVYKGGSWKDRAIWLNPGNRRHMEQTKCTSDIGFRCVMGIVGGKEHYRQ